MRALILESGLSRGALAGARALRAAGWGVGVAAPSAGLATRSRTVDRFHEVPTITDGAGVFCAGVADAIRAGGYEVVLAAGDAELLAISEGRDGLGAVVPHPSHDVLVAGLDKAGLMAAGRAGGLDVPQTRAATAEALAGSAFPVVVKPCLRLPNPARGPGRRLGTRMASSASEARDRIADIERAGGAALLQEHLTGHIVAWIGVVAPDGSVIAEVQQQSQRLWPPAGGISTRATTVPVSPAIAEGARALLERLSWWGLAQLQFIETADGRSCLIDLNPRLYGSLALAVGSGVNLPAIWAAAATGRSAPAATAVAGRRYHWLPGDARAAMAAPARSRPGEALRILRWAFGAQHSVWSARDPGPAAWYAARLALSRVGRRSQDEEQA